MRPLLLILYSYLLLLQQLMQVQSFVGVVVVPPINKTPRLATTTTTQSTQTTTWNNPYYGRGGWSRRFIAFDEDTTATATATSYPSLRRCCKSFSVFQTAAVPKRHQHVPDRKHHKVYQVLSFLATPITRPLSYLGRCFFRWAVYHTSQFVTALMIDPGVNHAIAHGIKDGMNLFCTQPNVKEKLLKLQQHLASDENGTKSLAKATGEDFPKAVLNFLVGVLLQGWDEPDRRRHGHRRRHSRHKTTTSSSSSSLPQKGASSHKDNDNNDATN